MTQKKIVLVGRPNVGKSTLFNRLVGRKIALVYDQPGVTRDWKSAQATLGDMSFELIDTAGLLDVPEGALSQSMERKTTEILSQANVILFIIDGKQGCTVIDQDLARMLRPYNVPVIVLVNKSEGRKLSESFVDASALGFENVIPISAEHGEGMPDIYYALMPYLAQGYEPGTKKKKFQDVQKTSEKSKKAGKRSPQKMDDLDQDLDQNLDDPLMNIEINEDNDEQQTSTPSNRPIQVAIVGRPNAGKSTLLNALIGSERVLTGDLPGLTRDSITVEWSYKGQSIKLVDTAGLRKRNRVVEKLEYLATADTRKAIQYAQVVIMVIDATCPFEKQDLTIARQVIEEGRALVLALNKWDLVKDKQEFMDEMEHTLSHDLSMVKGVFLVPISAIKEKNVNDLMDKVLIAYQRWNVRISTSKLNKWLEYALSRHSPPMVSGRRIRIKYMTQWKTRPPTFLIFCSKAESLPDSYIKYLSNEMRRDFDLEGTPLRIYLRQSDNPYDQKKKK